MDLINLFSKIDYKPKRTIRVVLFMNEENGLRGSLKYKEIADKEGCLLYTSPSPRDRQKSRMPSSA